jgi:hypothetical protein
MKTPKDEAFDELAQRQGMWGGGFQAKRAAAADKLQEREALKLALGALDSENPDIQCRAALAIRAALAQPAQGREWVWLTDEEIGKQTILAGFNPEWKIEIGMVFSIVRNLEAKLKEKNT